MHLDDAIKKGIIIINAGAVRQLRVIKPRLYLLSAIKERALYGQGNASGNKKVTAR